MKAAIFDLDGTLLDSIGAWERVFAYYLLSMDVKTDEELDKFYNDNGFVATVEHLQKFYIANKTVEEIETDIIEIMRQRYAHSIPPFEGACQYVTNLHRCGIPLVLFTANRKMLAECALERLGLSNCFYRLISASEAGISKKDPKTFINIAGSLAVPNEACYVFDDSASVLKAAAEAGLVPIGVCHRPKEVSLTLIKHYSRRLVTSFLQISSDLLPKCH